MIGKFRWHINRVKFSTASNSVRRAPDKFRALMYPVTKRRIPAEIQFFYISTVS